LRAVTGEVKMAMSEFEKQAFLQLLADQRARKDAEDDARFEAEYDAEIEPENEAARQERLQWAQNRRKQQS
jgi:hypothetical protein